MLLLLWVLLLLLLFYMYSYGDNEVVDADDDVNVFCERHFDSCLLVLYNKDDDAGDDNISYLGFEIHKRSKYWHSSSIQCI